MRERSRIQNRRRLCSRKAYPMAGVMLAPLEMVTSWKGPLCAALWDVVVFTGRCKQGYHVARYHGVNVGAQAVRTQSWVVQIVNLS